MSDNDLHLRMYLRAVERHHEMNDAILTRIAEGGDAGDVVSEIVAWLDGMDVLGDWDGDLIRRAWLAAGRPEDDFPVTLLTSNPNDAVTVWRLDKENNDA